MRGLLVVSALLAGLVGCRSRIDPIVIDDTPSMAAVVRPRGPAQCDVHDFPGAADVPAGSKNLGWVQVKREATDEETYLALRRAVCAAGGDALSSLSWVTEVNEREPSSIKANAWTLP